MFSLLFIVQSQIEIASPIDLQVACLSLIPQNFNYAWTSMLIH